MMKLRFGMLAFSLGLLGVTGPLVSKPAPALATAGLPRPSHVVVIVEENKTLSQIAGNAHAPFINALVAHGALFTNARGVTHPSLPNYLALFAGVTNDNGDGCPATGFSPSAPNLASELLAAHLSFGGYAETLPGAGSKVCAAGTYARKHAPWVAFSNVPSNLSEPFDDLPAYDKLPTVSFLIPNVDDDMHDGTIADGDAWLAKHLTSLVSWAKAHNTLIVLTWDEGYDNDNTIPTVLIGPMVKAGRYDQPINHYNTLRTLEDMFGLAHTGRAASVEPIRNCWQ
jgi:acid phosphatase